MAAFGSDESVDVRRCLESGPEAKAVGYDFMAFGPSAAPAGFGGQIEGSWSSSLAALK